METVLFVLGVVAGGVLLWYSFKPQDPFADLRQRDKAMNIIREWNEK